MTRDGVLSLWFGTMEPDELAIDAFYESRGIDAEILGNGKDENLVNTQGAGHRRHHRVDAPRVVVRR